VHRRKRHPAEEADEPKIPSQFKKDKDKLTVEGLPTFRSDVNTVQIEVAVLDNKGHFIPKIPRGNFRILEDNVPQQVASFSTNADAPMTISMVIEFNAHIQQYWGQGWYETLMASYGFVETLTAASTNQKRRVITQRPSGCFPKANRPVVLRLVGNGGDSFIGRFNVLFQAALAGS